MELERLEVILEMNTERFQDSMKKVMPRLMACLIELNKLLAEVARRLK